MKSFYIAFLSLFFLTIKSSETIFEHIFEKSRSRIPVSIQEIPILTIRNKSMIDGEENIKWVELVYSNFSAVGGYTKLKIYKNATLTTGNTTFVNHSSLIDFNITATGFSGGKEMLHIPLPNCFESLIFNNLGIHFYLFAGESFTITAFSETNSLVDICILWKESD